METTTEWIDSENAPDLGIGYAPERRVQLGTANGLHIVRVQTGTDTYFGDEEGDRVARPAWSAPHYVTLRRVGQNFGWAAAIRRGRASADVVHETQARGDQGPALRLAVAWIVEHA